MSDNTRCVCTHKKAWHEDLDGECSIAGCDCKKFFALVPEAKGEDQKTAVALTQPPPKSGGN